MLIVASVVRKLNPPTITSKCKILLATSKNFSSSTGYSPEELEQFRKVFRTVPSYEESISSKDLTPYLQSIKFIKPPEAYQNYVGYTDKILGGRIELTQFMKYIRAQHDPHLLLNELLINFDRDNDGYVTKKEFAFGIKNIKIHDSRAKNISYEYFLKEADDKISVSECKAWLNKNLVLA